MTALVVPGPGPGWFAAHLRAALLAPEPADATAVRPRPTPASLRDFLHALRQSAGGFAEGMASIPADIVRAPGMFASGGPALQTIGRGQVRSVPLPSAGQYLDAATSVLAHPLERAASAAGDVVAGGPPQGVSEQSFRTLGFVPGNLAGWETTRVPAILRRLTGRARVARADRFRQALEAADAQHGRNQVVRNSFLGRPVRPEVAPLTVVPPNPIAKLPSEMSPVEREVNDALVSLGAVRSQQSRGTPIHPLEQSVKEKRYQEALTALGAAPAPGPAKPRLRAAWKTSDGRWFPGTDHGDAANVAAAAGYGPETLVDDGFVTPSGRYLTRDQAFKKHNVSVSSDINAAQVFGREEAPWFGLISEELPPGPAAPVTQGPGFPGLRQILNDQSGRLGPLYHGSPHKFDRFDISKIGEGEGAQSFGHGLYFAENPGVAQSYRDRLAGDPEILDLRVGGRSVGPKNGFDYSPRLNGKSLAALEDNIRSQLIEQLLIDQAELVGVGPNGVQEHAIKVLDDITRNYKNEWPEAVGAVKSLRAKLARPGGVSLKVNQPEGAMYKVELPDLDAEQMLDWDAPYSQQSPKVQEAIKGLMGGEPPANMTGERLHEILSGGVSNAGRLQIGGKPGYQFLRDDVRLPEAGGGWSSYPKHILDAVDEALHTSNGNITMARKYIANRPNLAHLPEARQQINDLLTRAEQAGVAYLHSPFTNQRQTAEALNKAGVPGIRYLDQGSRHMGGGTLEVIPASEAPGYAKKGKDGWVARVRSANGGALTWGPSFPSADAAKAWGEQKLNEGTRNYVLFSDQGINILERGNTGLKMLLGMAGAGAGVSAAPIVYRSLSGNPEPAPAASPGLLYRR
jgi:hypothetical protein